jgi:hypothetical protein
LATTSIKRSQRALSSSNSEGVLTPAGSSIHLQVAAQILFLLLGEIPGALDRLNNHKEDKQAAVGSEVPESQFLVSYAVAQCQPAPIARRETVGFDGCSHRGYDTEKNVISSGELLAASYELSLPARSFSFYSATEETTK